MDKNQISKKIENLIDDIVKDFVTSTDKLSETEKLSLILGESLQSIYLVTVIEDEFNISFEDEEINLDFFQNITYIVDRIESHLSIKK